MSEQEKTPSEQAAASAPQELSQATLMLQKFFGLFSGGGARNAGAKVAVGVAAGKEWKKFFQDEYTEEEIARLERESVDTRQLTRLRRKIVFQSYIIFGLLFLQIILSPVLKPIYDYWAMTTNKQVSQLVPLTAPNLTDQAVLSWAATGITEVMTFGFGDFDQRILAQRHFFTDEGWDAFTRAVREQNMRANFKARQLVLTTVPADAAVIVSKGVDLDGEYKWVVQMPIIMTFTTNNNVTARKRGVVTLTIVRVPSSENVAGIGIKGWVLP